MITKVASNGVDGHRRWSWCDNVLHDNMYVERTLPTRRADAFIDWFIQERRYDIFEGLGCYPATPYTIVWLFSYAIWPIIISMISATFCGELFAFTTKTDSLMPHSYERHCIRPRA